MAEQRPERSDRASAAISSELAPDSLVGSFFHGSDEEKTQGLVVAEVAPGVYLVEYYDWITGFDSTHQALVNITDMNGWRFYDTAEWMNNSYHSYISKHWDMDDA